MCLYIALEMIFSDCLNILSRSKNSSTQRSVLKRSCMQMIENNFLSLPLNLQQLHDIKPLIIRRNIEKKHQPDHYDLNK